MNSTTTRTGLLRLVVFLISVPVAPAPGGRAAQFVSGVRLVQVYATVTDRSGAPILGLTAADFSVRDEGELQSIAAFATGTVPLSLAIAIDRSFSMAGQPLDAEKRGARALLAELRADDQVMVVAIGSQTEVVAPLGTDRDAAESAVERLESWGTTPLYDAAAAAIRAIAPARGRRALVLLSDGSDRYSATPAAALIDEARRQDVMVFPIAIGKKRPPAFAELASVTGGQSFLVAHPRNLAAVLTTVARDLRSQYLIGYLLPRADGRWHAIDVRVDRPEARVRARDGYVAPQGHL
ncbi:MAG: VWA domain-containing protein [Betaproteobacteria bacterium]